MSAGLCISFFGPIRVCLDGGALPPLRSRKALSLLALLVLRNGRPAARGWLATSLWPDADLSTALSSLRPVISELRKALGREGQRLKAGDRNSVAFDVEGLSIDVLEFDHAIEAGDLESAVQKYAGLFWEGCEEDWAFQERRIRQDALLSALNRLGEMAGNEAAHERAVSIFRRAVSVDPYRDLPRRGLIQAYAASGDHHAALQEYREYAHLLSREFGTAPEEETVALYDHLRHEARKPNKLSSIDKKEGSPSGHIPTPLTALVGRDDERLDVSALLRHSRLVTLSGFGGIGKTRLALAVAADNSTLFPDGVWFVGLDELNDGHLLARQVGGVLGLGENASKAWLRNVTDHLREKRVLLVLDNCEHLREACAQLVLHLLSECPGLKVLTTGRQALGIVGETSWIVPALAVPAPNQLPEGRATLQRVALGYEGVQLFVDRARAAVTSFSLTATNARMVADICFRLEGIPLALELAAARVKTLTVEQISERLRARLDLSPIGRITSSRQQTLRSTLEWSHELLTDAEQIYFRRFSVFVGGWTIDAATHLCPDGLGGDRIADLTSSLIDKSLINFDADGRYRWSEIVRQYAEEKLQATDEAEAFKLRHLAWSVALAEEAEPKLKGPDQQVWLQRLEAEVSNLRAAAGWAAANERTCDEGLRLTSALARYWYIRGGFKEGRARLRAALGCPGAERRSLARAKALYGLGILAYRQGDYDEAQANHEESLSIRCQLGDDHGTAESLMNLGNIAHSRGNHAKAEILYEETLDMLTQIDDEHGMALVLSNLAIIKLSQGQNRAARNRFEQSLKMWRKLGDRSHTAWDLTNLGILAAERGDYLTAQAHLQESLPIFEELGDRRGVGWSLLKLSEVEKDELRFGAAQALLEKSLVIFDDLGDKHGRACCIDELSSLARDLGDMKRARSHMQEAFELFQEIDDNQAVGNVIQKRGVLHRLEGDLDSAAAAGAEALAMFIENRESRGIMRVLQEQAMIAAGRANYERAAATWGTADALREELDLFVSPNEMNRFGPLLATAREALGEPRFESAFDRGRLRRWEEVVKGC